MRWRQLVPLVSLVSSAAAAQTAVVDEGTFTFTRSGSPYGNETFKIVRRLGADGVEYVAQCTRTLDGRVVKTALTTDSFGSPTMYSRTTAGAANQLTARRAVNRLTVNNDEGGKASTKDYAFASGSVILDEDVIHQFYFVTWRDARSLGFVVPGGRTNGTGTLTEVGREDLVIGGASIPAVHYVFGSANGKREIWIDSDKRLLKVSFPDQQITGVRDLPPR